MRDKHQSACALTWESNGRPPGATPAGCGPVLGLFSPRGPNRPPCQVSSSKGSELGRRITPTPTPKHGFLDVCHQEKEKYKTPVSGTKRACFYTPPSQKKRPLLFIFLFVMMMFFSFRSVTSWNEKLAGAPGGCWNGALPGAEARLGDWGRRGDAPLGRPSAVGFPRAFPGLLRRRLATARAGEETSGDARGATGSRSPAPSSSEAGERRSRCGRRGGEDHPRRPRPAPPRPRLAGGLPARRPRTLLAARGSPAPGSPASPSLLLSQVGCGQEGAGGP